MKRTPLGAYDPVYDEDLKRLGEQLGARSPVFTEEIWLKPGTIAWDVDLLPRVFCAPDVFAAMRKRIPEACAPSIPHVSSLADARKRKNGDQS